jgi:hypothetical protein
LRNAVEIRKGIKLKYQGSGFCCLEKHYCLPISAEGRKRPKIGLPDKSALLTEKCRKPARMGMHICSLLLRFNPEEDQGKPVG